MLDDDSIQDSGEIQITQLPFDFGSLPSDLSDLRNPELVQQMVDLRKLTQMMGEVGLREIVMKTLR